MTQHTASEATAAALEAAWAGTPGVRCLFDSDDPQCARESVGHVFRPHRLDVPGGAQRPLHARMEYLPLGPLSLSRLRYGRSVDIVPGPLERFYLLQLPLAGRARIETGVGSFESTPACASLLSPQPDLRMSWDDGNDQLIVRLDADLVRRYGVAWCGDETLRPPVFDPRLEPARHPVLQELLLSMLHLAARSPDGASAHRSYPLSVIQIQNRLLAALLGTQPHSAQERLAASSPPLAPRYVRAVEDYLVAHPHEEVTPERLAALAGVSVRSLFLGFQRYRRIGPMKLLREIRLHKVRDELLLAEAATTVTDVALRWGFYHLGRFAHEYRVHFGETPSQTLARRH